MTKCPQGGSKNNTYSNTGKRVVGDLVGAGIPIASRVFTRTVNNRIGETERHEVGPELRYYCQDGKKEFTEST